MKQHQNQRKKFSTATLETINRLSPNELETHGIIQSARVSGYICPLCGSGEGSHGTGMTQNPKIENHTSLHCFGCGKSFNPLHLCALHYGLEFRRDFPDLMEKICADFNIPIEYEEFAFHSSFRTSSRKPRKLSPLDAKELKNIQADLNASVEPLKTFMKYQSEQKWRGFDLEFLLAHGCRLINDWFAPSIRGTNQQPSTPTSRMIIPSGESSYLARLTDQVNNYDIKARPFIKEKVHAGHKTLFNPDALQNEIVFVVEGYIDAMSLELAGFNCVALGGCAEGYLLLDALDKVDKYPQIIILFDPDDAGIKAAKSLHEELLQIKCPSIVRFLSKPTRDIANYDLACASGSAVMSSDNKIDANNILQKFGVEVLRSILQDILDNSLSELNAVEAELGKKDTAGLTDDDWAFIFSGNHSDLADKFQSAKKIGSAITLLKSCDSILITADDLNRHNELFCVRNGVVNLQTGELYPLDPKYLITQQSPAIYRPSYQNPIVENFAIVEELPQGGRLDVAKFKNLTGSDFIPIRKLHQEQINIEPHFSPILSGNYRSELSDTCDPGLLRRLLNINFTPSFIGNQRDPYLKKKLAEPDAQSGLLSYR